MKLALFALVAAAAAQEDSGYAQEDTTGYEAGYEAPEAGYEAPAFQGYVHKVSVCLGTCPDHARCQNVVTGACTAGYSAPATYAAPVAQESYGSVQDEGTGYRRLQDTTGDYAQEGTTYDAAESYAAPVAYSAPATSCGTGFIDLDCSQLRSNIVLWIAFALLFIPALFFFYGSQDSKFEFLLSIEQDANANTQFHCIPDPKNTKKLTNEQLRACITKCQVARFVSGIICFVASLAYLTMALGYGYTTRCCDGRQFFYARYIDWTITTPLMLYKILSYTTAGLHEKQFAYAFDILMIIAGLIGALVCGNDKWIFFGFSMLAFLPVMALICAYNKKGDNSIIDEDFYDAYSRITTLTVLLWSFYPIVWILAEGTNTICANAEAICYTVLDILAKSFFGYLCVMPRSLYCSKTGDLVQGSML